MSHEIICNDDGKIYTLLKDLKSWDFIDNLDLTAKQIEIFYSKMHLDVEHKERNDYVEKTLKLPGFVSCFYYFIFLYEAVPTQEQYIRFYYYLNKEWIDKNIIDQYDEALKGRLSRFYPSMLRDFHFYHVLRESQHFEKVLFILKYDLEGKVDVFVRKDSEWYGLQLRTKTFNSDKYYKQKPNRNAIAVKATLIDLPISLKKAKSLNTLKDSIKLYDSSHIHIALDAIAKLKQPEISEAQQVS
jgi:hypothetical protein